MAPTPASLRPLLDVLTLLSRTTTAGRLVLARAADVLPVELLESMPALGAAIAEARDALVVSLPRRDVEKALRRAWGAPPARVLDELELEDPVAVRAASVVVRGVADGQPVAIKVARPGLAAAVRSELALLDGVTRPLAALLGDPAGATRVVAEVRTSLVDELDLEHEADGQAAMRRTLRRVDGVEVAAVDRELSGETVLVSAWLDGHPLGSESVARDAETTVAVGRRVLAAQATALRAGRVLIDMRPGHVLVGEDGGVGLVGAGVSGVVARERGAASLEALAALTAGDGERFASVASGAGDDLDLLDEADANAVIALAEELAGPLLRGEGAVDGPALASTVWAARERLDEALPLAVRAAARTVEGDTLAARGALQTVALVAALGWRRHDWVGELIAAYDAA